jgi:hypothetical protein
MAHLRKDRTAALIFDAIEVEGALISPAMLARIAQHQAAGQTEAAYGVPKGLTLRDEIARYFRIGQAMFQELVASDTPSAAATLNFIERLMRDVFGFADIARIGMRVVKEHEFTISLEAIGGRVPVTVVPTTDDLDRPSADMLTAGQRRSASLALQNWLNASDSALWGLCSNGMRLRLMRDNASLTRPAYIEADLRRIFEGDAFADFTALWLLVHASRFGVAGTLPSDCSLERWRDAGQKEGVAARDKLRDGVEAALLSLGTGFLSHPNNGPLRGRLQSGVLPLPEFFSELLRLVYRLIFLFAAEDRDLLHPPGSEVAARKLYAEGYSVGVLRDRSVRRAAWDRHHDRWEGLLITFAALERGEKRLGLPALAGLFARDVTPNLQDANLSNRSLMEAIFRLAWLRDDSGLLPVNWRDMEAEELGSVYESLLELTAQLSDDGRELTFAEGGEAKGHARKTTGSYYTPDSLVQALLDSALVPVLDRVEAEANDAENALLGVTVLDPACGSGHFLLAAARRIATRLASVRTGGLATPTDYRHALRDVARACIYGVDRNPMAVELTKVALWIETVEPGKPLGFFDANIRCGDALLGVYDLTALEGGIPDTAYKALTGDDKNTAKHFEKNNEAERQGQGVLDFGTGAGRLPAAAPMVGEAKALRAMPEDSSEELVSKRERFEAALRDPGRWKFRVAADLYVAAFLTPKIGGVPVDRSAVTIPTTAHVWDALAGRRLYGPLVGRTQDLASTARAFHWPLEFPDIMASGGFDIVLGNPPWERVKLQEQEFFASRDPAIAQAPNAAARGRLIRKLKEAALGTRERTLYEDFQSAKRAAEASSVFARISAENCGRFPLTGRGDVNTYALFAELFARLISTRGRAGLIVPTGIATDATTSVFFGTLVDSGRLASLLSFENEEFIFPSVHHAFRFALLTIRSAHEQSAPEFVFFARQPRQIDDHDRRFKLSATDIARINPNTKTAPVFRSRADAELTSRIYTRLPVLIDESNGNNDNPWGVSFMRMFDMANDSGLFRTAAQLAEAGFVPDGRDWLAPAGTRPRQTALALIGGNDNRSFILEGGSSADKSNRYVPLYEAKLIHQFDHRWATYDDGDSRDATADERADPRFEPRPRYWLPAHEVADRLVEKGWTRGWLMGWRDITGVEKIRTLIAGLIPTSAVGDKFLLIFVDGEPHFAAALYGAMNSLVGDFVARQKVGGVSLKYFTLKQLPFPRPEAFSSTDIAFIVRRVLELTYTSHSMAPFARDLGYNGGCFPWDEDRRAQLRAELDAWYARAYGLTRDELRYVLDPADVKGPDYPSETFRVLKKSEIATYGEYRTARLVLQAWDRFERGELTT